MLGELRAGVKGLLLGQRMDTQVGGRRWPQPWRVGR